MNLNEYQADKLIDEMKEKLKGVEQIKPPEWAAFVKTGVHKERPPQQEDWWYIRAAAVLRKVGSEGKIVPEMIIRKR